MNRNGTGCKFCSSHDEPQTIDIELGYRLVYCPRCFTVLEAWERDGRCLSRVDVDKLMTGALTILDLGEAIAPGKRSKDPLDLESYAVDDGKRAEGVPLQAQFKVA